MRLRVQLTYTVPDLATMMGMDRRTVTRWLIARDVPIERIGRVRIVWLADLVEAMPELARSIERERELTG